VLKQQIEIQNILSELMLLEKDENRIYQKVRDRATSGGEAAIGAVKVLETPRVPRQTLRGRQLARLTTTQAVADSCGIPAARTLRSPLRNPEELRA
jgi:hypothetical protein